MVFEDVVFRFNVRVTMHGILMNTFYFKYVNFVFYSRYLSIDIDNNF